jgi:hypothetical protein
VNVSAGGAHTADTGTWNSQLGSAILASNPSLSNAYQASCPNCVIVGSGNGVGVAATSGTDATTFLATRFLNALVPSQLVSAPNAQAGLAPQQLGTVSNLGVPPPNYDVQTYTGRSILAHYMTPLSGSAWWAVTDAATAATTWSGLDDFALQTSDSLSAAPANATYVAPTSAAMQAAVPNMTAQPDGTLLPDPHGGAVNGVEPYPLTYVEYAFAPAAPLMNGNCTANTAAQTTLNQWLTYLVGGGQSNLPFGMAPLPASLAVQARAAIARVGSAAAACTPSSSSAGSGSSAASASGGSSGSGTANSGAFSSAYPLLSQAIAAANGSSSSASGRGGSAGSPLKSAVRRALSLSAFESVSPASWALPLLAVLVLGLLLPGLILMASGRSLTDAIGLGAGQASPPAQPPDPEVSVPADGAET